jgi:hypothetical protein
MARVTSRWRFERAETPEAFLDHTRPSTNAMSALHQWAAANLDVRSYDVIEDEDEHLVADLSTDDDDCGSGDMLDERCRVYNVQRNRIPIPEPDDAAEPGKAS